MDRIALRQIVALGLLLSTFVFACSDENTAGDTLLLFPDTTVLDTSTDITTSLDGLTSDAADPDTATDTTVDAGEDVSPSDSQGEDLLEDTAQGDANAGDADTNSADDTQAGPDSEDTTNDADDNDLSWPDAVSDIDEGMSGDGASCATAFSLKNPPLEVSGNSSEFGSDYAFGADECPGETGGWGLASADVPYVFTPAETATYTVTLNADFDSVLYVTTDCNNTANSCMGANDLVGAGVEESLTLEMTEGVPYYIVVDGYSNTNNLNGPYTLSLGGPCTPNCGEGSCDDGCGGVCPCAEGFSCNQLNGLCEVGVGGDTCDQASVIVDLPFAALGDTSGAYGDAYSVASFTCEGLSLGAGYGSKDAVFRFTPKSNTTYAFTLKPSPDFDAALYLVGDCDSLSATCVGGADAKGPGGAETLTLALNEGVTYYAIVDGAGPSIGGTFALGVDFDCKPTCEAGTCADDGCGGVCPCAEGQTCNEGICCIPECDGSTCVADGCGGVCACAPGTTCVEESEQCISAEPGDQCANPLTIDAESLPASILGTTTGFLNDYSYAANTCQGESSGWGAGSNDVAYSLTPEVSGVYEVSLVTFADFDATLYIVSDCTDIDETCLAGDEEIAQGVGEKVEDIFLALEGGTTYFIIVDGYANESNVSGNFQLDVSAPCQPTCTAGLCGGPDGCGSTCGCTEGKLCHPETNACVSSMGGDFCAEATSVPPLSAAAGDTNLATDAYGVMPGSCPGFDGDGGFGSADQAYLMTPSVTGVYPITLESEFDGMLYAVKNCSDVDNTCLAGVDDVSEGDTETLFLTASANQEYYIIVDGFGLGSEGVYLLNIGAPCIIDCVPGTCGSNGCGGLCQCSIGETCNAEICE
jgi:hypothetical protein